jgi:hypothetical protein
LKRFDSQNEPTAEYERYLDFWTFGPAERLFQEEKLNQSDVEHLLRELSFLGLEIALSNKKAGYDNAITKLLDVILEYQSNLSEALLEKLRRFLDADISFQDFQKLIPKLVDILKGELRFTRHPDSQLKIETEEEIREWIEYYDVALEDNEVGKQVNLNQVNVELLGDLIEVFFKLRQEELIGERGSCETGLNFLVSAKAQIAEKFSNVDSLLALHKSIWLISLPKSLQESQLDGYSVKSATRNSLYDLICEQENNGQNKNENIFSIIESIIHDRNDDRATIEHLESYRDALQVTMHYMVSESSELANRNLQSIQSFKEKFLKRKEILEASLSQDLGSLELTTIALVAVFSFLIAAALAKHFNRGDVLLFFSVLPVVVLWVSSKLKMGKKRDKMRDTIRFIENQVADLHEERVLIKNSVEKLLAKVHDTQFR